MSTETELAPVLSEAPPCWPPVTHLIRKKDCPPKPGTMALCGAKLMGIDLRGMALQVVCKKCKEIERRECGL